MNNKVQVKRRHYDSDGIPQTLQNSGIRQIFSLINKETTSELEVSSKSNV